MQCAAWERGLRLCGVPKSMVARNVREQDRNYHRHVIIVNLDHPRTTHFIGVRLVSLHVTDVQPFPDENEEEEERTTACGQQRSAYNTDPVLSFLQAGYGG